MRWRIALAAGVALLLFAFGLGTGWTLWGKRETPRPETYAREVRQVDGSLVLERKPQPDAKPAQAVPKGAKVERVIQVVVRPVEPVLDPIPGPSDVVTPPTSGSVPVAVDLSPPRTPCPPVRVDLTLLRMQDQSRRVVASSPDGQVVGGVDVPVDPTPEPPRPMLYSAGVAYQPRDRTWGIWATRDWGPLRLGGQVVQVRTQSSGGISYQGWLTAGLKF